MRKAVTLIVLAASAACGTPSHENPFDPSTPSNQQARATLAGSVTLEPLGATAPTLAGVRISIPGAGVVDTDPTGQWSLPDVPPGTYTVQASKLGWVTSSVAGVAVTLDDGYSTVTVPPIALAAARGNLAGRVTLAGAASSAGIVVSASGPASANAITDATGAFLVVGLPVGDYTVVARKDPEWTPSAPLAVTVVEGGAAALPVDPVLSLLLTASISGQAGVERPAGASAGIDVSLAGVDVNGAPVVANATTQLGGGYTLANLPQGTYAVTLSKAGYDAHTISGLFVAAGAAVTASPVVLPVATGEISGTATLSPGTVTGFQVGADHSGVVVTLAGVDVPVPAAVTDPAGAYRFVGVPVSTSGAAYTVTAQKPSFLNASATVTAVANATAPAPALTLNVNAGALSGTVLLRDDVAGAGDNATHAGTAVSVTGTAFNGTSWSAGASTDATGAFLVSNLPPGSYDVLATSTSRVCEPLAGAAILPGSTSAAGTVRCVDALPPGAVALGAPQPPPGGQSGYAAGSSVTVPIATPAVDATSPFSNFRGYQVVVGSAADWAAATTIAGQPGALTFAGLAPDAANTLWTRAVDWSGNAGPVASLQVVTDTIPPPAPSVSTPRPFVNATTTSVTLSGAEGDATFAGYEICSLSQAAPAACAASAPGGCAWTQTAAAFALSLTAGQKTCLWARAFDRAGNRGAASSLGVGGVVSDLSPPSPPTLAPAYDATLLTIRAPWVDLFVTAPATDGPAGGAPWQDVAWLEVDTGSGFHPLCRDAACRPGDVWSPCGCACTDPRLLCDGPRFAGIRAPLLEGTRNTVAVRAVDLAGNVGSGVSQQVVVESTGTVAAATAAFEEGPNLRGNVLAYSQFSPGAGMPHGIVVDLGPDRRLDASDVRCDKTTIVASGYGRGISPANPTLVVDARYQGGVWRHDAGADGRFCTGDDTSAQLKVPELDPVNGYYYADGVSGAGDVVAWWERLNPPAPTPPTAKLYAQEAGPDRAFGTADDPRTLLGTFSEIRALTAGTRALLVRYRTCTTCAWTWRLFNANGAGGYTAGVTTWDPAPHAPLASIPAAGLSSEGRRAAWADSAGNLVVRSSGANDVFDGTDDEEAWTAIPPAWGLWLGGSDNAVAVDGGHVLVASGGSPVSYLVHWWAGLDGVFGTSDDSLSRTHPTSGSWGALSIDASLAAYAEDGDVKLVDLSTLRWEAAPQGGFSTGWSPLRADGRGNLLYKESGRPIVARTPAGNETSGPGGSVFSALGGDLLVIEGANVRWYGADAGGAWFGPGAPAPATLYTATGTATDVALGGGKAIVLETVGSNAYRFKILEPGAGTLATFGATGTVLDALGVNQGWAMAYGITARQAFVTCNGITTNLCVRTASGVSNRFVAGDPVASMAHPAGSPRAPALVQDARAFLVSGDRMLLAEFSPPVLYLFDAGPDHLFNTADDRGRKLADGFFSSRDIALAGRIAGFIADGAPAGRQVYLVPGFGENPAPVSEHYSTKTGLALEPGGRAFWVDSVFVPQAIFVRVP